MTIVAQNTTIDPELAEKVNENGWAYHFRKRAEEAEQAAEHWYDEYQKLLTERTHWGFAKHRDTLLSDAMQGVNDLADRAEQAENELEQAYDQVERLQTILENERIWQSSRMALVNLATEERNEAEEQTRQLQSDNRDLGDTVLNQGVVIRELTQMLRRVQWWFEQSDIIPNDRTLPADITTLLNKITGVSNGND